MSIGYRPTVDDLGDKIIGYVRRWVKIWGLSSWTFEVRWTTAKYSDYAEVDTTDLQYSMATLYFNTRRFRAEKCTPFQIEDLVAHELGHVSNVDLIDTAHRVKDLSGHQMQLVEDRMIERLLKAIRKEYNT